jgi:hypothetical protein
MAASYVIDFTVGWSFGEPQRQKGVPQQVQNEMSVLACFESFCAFPLHPVLFGGERFDD